MLAARARPPFLPPRRPSATAAAFFRFGMRPLYVSGYERQDRIPLTYTYALTYTRGMDNKNPEPLVTTRGLASHPSSRDRQGALDSHTDLTVSGDGMEGRTMDEARQQRGAAIAAQKQIRKTTGGYLVPSQSGRGKYAVIVYGDTSS